MRPAGLVALFFLLPLGGACRLSPKEFHLAGTVTLAPPLRARPSPPNAMLFVVVRNRGNVPLAVRRIVNPQFPASFTLESEDLVVPGSRPPGPLLVSVELNTHGRVGAPARGDLSGEHRGMVFPGDSEVHVVIEREEPGALPMVRGSATPAPLTQGAVRSLPSIKEGGTPSPIQKNPSSIEVSTEPTKAPAPPSPPIP